MYHSIDNVGHIRRGPGLAGLFGCDVDPDEFAAENKVQIYPGKMNVWLFSRRRGEGPNIDEVIEEFITDPLDTSMFTDNVVMGEVKKLTADKVKINLAAWGYRTQGTMISTLTSNIDLGNEVDYYMVAFAPPSDAPTKRPWPLIGCAEEADWVLSYALSDIKIATGKPSEEVNTSSSTKPVTAADVEKQKQVSIEYLTASRNMGGDEGTPWWVWAGVIGAVSVGGLYLYSRTR